MCVSIHFCISKTLINTLKYYIELLEIVESRTNCKNFLRKCKDLPVLKNCSVFLRYCSKHLRYCIVFFVYCSQVLKK